MYGHLCPKVDFTKLFSPSKKLSAHSFWQKNAIQVHHFKLAQTMPKFAKSSLHLQFFLKFAKCYAQKKGSHSVRQIRRDNMLVKSTPGRIQLNWNVWATTATTGMRLHGHILRPNLDLLRFLPYLSLLSLSNLN